MLTFSQFSEDVFVLLRSMIMFDCCIVMLHLRLSVTLIPTIYFACTFFWWRGVLNGLEDVLSDGN